MLAASPASLYQRRASREATTRAVLDALAIAQAEVGDLDAVIDPRPDSLVPLHVAVTVAIVSDPPVSTTTMIAVGTKLPGALIRLSEIERVLRRRQRHEQQFGRGTSLRPSRPSLAGAVEPVRPIRPEPRPGGTPRGGRVRGDEWHVG